MADGLDPGLYSLPVPGSARPPRARPGVVWLTALAMSFGARICRRRKVDAIQAEADLNESLEAACAGHGICVLLLCVFSFQAGQSKVERGN
jgi:hypothetical protein